MRRLRHRLLLATAFALALVLPVVAEEGAALPTASSAARATAAPSPESDTTPGEASRAERSGGPARPRAEALIRALMVLSSAGGGRPFPLVPR